jgi:hypothetical protein
VCDIAFSAAGDQEFDAGFGVSLEDGYRSASQSASPSRNESRAACAND